MLYANKNFREEVFVCAKFAMAYNNNMNKYTRYIFCWFIASFAWAQNQNPYNKGDGTTRGGSEVKQILVNFMEVVVSPLVTLLFAVAMLYFIFGLFTFVQSAAGSGSDQSLADGKRHMLYGVIGMTIMVSVWAIIGVITNSIGVNQTDIIQGTGGFR